MACPALRASASHDLDYRLTALNVLDGGTAVSSLSYGYGDGLNLTAVNDNVVSANSSALGYTPANRLATANGPWGNASYSYDSVGNRLNHVVTQGGTTTRLASYGTTNNRITGMTENGAALRTYTYDGNGNILTDTRPGEVFAFTSNVRNRPTSVTRNSVAYASYAYNGLEQLVSRSTTAPGGPSGNVHYVYDLVGHLIAEADGATGATTREYLWLDDLPIGLIQGGTLYLVHSDHLARPIRITDAARATQWQATWGPWGEPHAISGSLALDLRFPGQLYQIETGLHYNWHRHYDPVTGRYTQPDPLRFVDGPSVYVYAVNSPFIYSDQDGRNAAEIIRGIVISSRAGAIACTRNAACRSYTRPVAKYIMAAAFGAYASVTDFGRDCWEWLFPPTSHMAQHGKGNVAATSVVNAWVQDGGPKDKCGWLDANKKRFSAAEIRATEKAWGCRRSRQSSNR